MSRMESTLRVRRPVLVGLVFGLAVAACCGVAFAEDPATKVLLGPPEQTQPADAWSTIAKSFEQFGHLGYLLRLFLSLSLSVVCAWIVALHPRRATRLDPLSDLEERKALILLGVVGAVIAELSHTSQTLAFVIFGIGALLRFRTLLDNTKLTGKAIMVVIIGLACGMSQWAMAVFVTIFAWGLIFWLDSHMSCRVKVRMNTKGDLREVATAVANTLRGRHARIKNSAIYESKRQLLFLAHVPSSLDPVDLENDLRARIPHGQECDITVDVE